MSSWAPRAQALLLLFMSRSSGVLVSLLFLPLYARLLDPADFGRASLVLAGQALALALDLGMAQLTTREVAAAPSKSAALAAWRRADCVLRWWFCVVALVALVVVLLSGIAAPIALLCVLLFWATASQNLAQAAMIATGDVSRAAVVQSVGALTKAGITLAALHWVHPGFDAFLVSQTLGTLALLVVNREMGQRRLGADGISPAEPGQVALTARRGLPLLAIAALGAAGVQADKLIVGHLMGPAAVAPYFLAFTFCLTPIAVFAGPVAQLFQPLVIRAHAAGDAAALLRRSREFALVLCGSVLLPTAAMWLLREPLVAFWLGAGPLTAEVTRLTAWLLPAAALGAIGNLPLGLLAAVADFRFQARLSAVLTPVVLAAVAWAASRQRLDWVCMAYLGHFGLLTALLWWRSGSLPGVASAARVTAAIAAAGVAAGGSLLLLERLR